eukprot:80984-Amphidinium_carterae.1
MLWVRRQAGSYRALHMGVWQPRAVRPVQHLARDSGRWWPVHTGPVAAVWHCLGAACVWVLSPAVPVGGGLWEEAA